MPQVSTPIIDALLHPPLGLLSFALIGNQLGQSTHTYNPPQGPLAFTYGLQWSIVAVDPGIGFQIGAIEVYYDPIIQVLAHYHTFDGTLVIGEWHWFYSEGDLWFWEAPLPTDIEVYVPPGFELSLAWLQT